MKTNNLKPCPLCGGTNLEVAKDFYYNNITRLTSDAVECKGCGLFLHIDDWNTRPIEDGLQAEIEKLKAVLMDIWHITKEELDEENAILETRGDYIQRLERNINRIETITRKELDKECGQ